MVPFFSRIGLIEGPGSLGSWVPLVPHVAGEGVPVEGFSNVKFMHQVEPPIDGHKWVVGSLLILATVLSSERNTSPFELIMGTDFHAFESKRHLGRHQRNMDYPMRL